MVDWFDSQLGHTKGFKKSASSLPLTLRFKSCAEDKEIVSEKYINLVLAL